MKTVGGACAVDGIDFYGDWDATKETGVPATLFGENGSYGLDITFHRSLFSGFADLQVWKSSDPVIDVQVSHLPPS